jgi:T4 RnlA family RNA ligase
MITYDDAQEICKKYGNFNFSEHLYRIRGYKVSTFDYFICGYNDFARPLPARPDINAFDMRGTTFVFDKDGKIWKKFLMLPKFFNLNQVESTLYHNVKDKKIKHISIKEDGSLVAFMMTPDEKLFAKTIRGFDNDQATAAYGLLYQWEDHVLWVKSLLNQGLTPLFEYVSWDNRIVLKYSSPELRFIGARDNHNGMFFPASEMNQNYIPSTIYQVPKVEATLDELIELAKTEENKEGWVVITEDGWYKIKTAWYFHLHGIRTENVFREDYVIKNYYEETLDDIISQLDPKEDEDAFKFIDTVTGAVDNYSAYIDKCVDELRDKLENYYINDWADFAKNCHKKPFFGFVKFWNTEEYRRRKIEFILQKAYRLNRAKSIVEKWKN